MKLEIKTDLEEAKQAPLPLVTNEESIAKGFMKPDLKTRVLSWRAEIAEELEEAHAAAAAAADEMAVNHRDLWALLRLLQDADALGRVPPIEAPLMIRAQADRADLEQAKTRASRALTDVEQARRRISELGRALAQIDRCVVPVEETL
jgi:hypothetical protein